MTDIQQRIEKIWGTDNRLHQLIGPFVMNPDIIRINRGYPFKNTEDHLWYIALKNKNMVMGFLAVCNGRICNDFTWQDCEVLEFLLKKVLDDMEKEMLVSFIAEDYEVGLLEELGFQQERRTKRYVKMVKVT
ncbi:MAG: hypothetical protein LBV71_03595 [Prevotella sp.]|jgi:hypothetical protein|nr:hypothetical protein [Prevotella sp.]